MLIMPQTFSLIPGYPLSPNSWAQQLTFLTVPLQTASLPPGCVNGGTVWPVIPACGYGSGPNYGRQKMTLLLLGRWTQQWRRQDRVIQS